MVQWDYQHPNILELRYEKMFGNEVDEFERMFQRFGLRKSQFRRTLKFVKNISFDQLKKHGNSGFVTNPSADASMIFIDENPGQAWQKLGKYFLQEIQKRQS